MGYVVRGHGRSCVGGGGGVVSCACLAFGRLRCVDRKSLGTLLDASSRLFGASVLPVMRTTYLCC